MVSCWFARTWGGPGAADWWKLSLGVTRQDFLRMGISMGISPTKSGLKWKNSGCHDVTCKHLLIPRVQPIQWENMRQQTLWCSWKLNMRFWPAGMIIPQGKPTKAMTYRMILVRSGRGLVAVPEWSLNGVFLILFQWKPAHRWQFFASEVWSVCQGLSMDGWAVCAALCGSASDWTLPRTVDDWQCPVAGAGMGPFGYGSKWLDRLIARVTSFSLFLWLRLIGVPTYPCDSPFHGPFHGWF